jgi:D-alanine-D-alanine ligase
MSSSLPKDLDIAVLRGGWSEERSVSMSSGLGVLSALRDAGYTVVRDIILQQNVAELLTALTPRPAVVFNALHGRGGEDGIIQGILEMLAVPYTHSGVLASALAMDKAMTKAMLQTIGVPCPAGQTLSRTTLAQASAPLIATPCVLKPVAEGSSLGIFIIHTPQEWTEAVRSLPLDHRWWLLESYIPGREITVPVMGKMALPVIEIVPKTGWYDYASKYQADVHADFVIPAPLPASITADVQQLSVRAHQALHCRGVSRSDWRYNPSAPPGQQLFFLEINTQPGMTPLSLLPASAATVGISYINVVEHCLSVALEC